MLPDIHAATDIGLLLAKSRESNIGAEVDSEGQAIILNNQLCDLSLFVQREDVHTTHFDLGLQHTVHLPVPHDSVASDNDVEVMDAGVKSTVFELVVDVCLLAIVNGIVAVYLG